MIKRFSILLVFCAVSLLGMAQSSMFLAEIISERFNETIYNKVIVEKKNGDIELIAKTRLFEFPLKLRKQEIDDIVSYWGDLFVETDKWSKTSNSKYERWLYCGNFNKTIILRLDDDNKKEYRIIIRNGGEDYD